MKKVIKSLGIVMVLTVIVAGLMGCGEPDPYNDKPSETVTIIGLPQVGETLTAITSNLNGTGTVEVNYEWKRNGSTDIGVDNNTYIVQASDIGSSITVTIQYSFSEWGWGSLTSSPTAVIKDGSEGLAYTLINNNTAYSVSKGTSTSSIVIIPVVHKGLPVIEISDSGFSSYTNLKDIIIPNGVTRIGNYAFFNCGNLTSVTVPIGVTSIGNFAFQGCNSLNTIYYSGMNNTAWNSIIIGSNNTSLTNANVYYYSEVYPGTVNTHWRFDGRLPLIWTTQGLAFYRTRGGWEVSIGSATDINIVIPAIYEGLPVTGIGHGAFYNRTSLTSITIPNSVTSIDDYAFYGCTSLMSITIPNGVTSIPYNAFFGCTSLTSITIPNSVTSIGSEAFYNCTSLTSIIIPNGVTSIGYSAFTNTGIWNNAQNNSLVYINNWLVGYKGIISDVVINTNIIGITDNAFSNCKSLTSITIPNSVKNIETYALFYGCTSLTSVTIPNSVTSIRYEAFYGCTSLTSITIPNSVKSIGIRAFSNCKSLTSITIPNSVTSIGESAFGGCTSLTSATISNNVTVIGGLIFNGCNSLKSVTLGKISSCRTDAFPGNLAWVAVGGGAGTYTTNNPGENAVWVKK